jgi:hypothetical protein
VERTDEDAREQRLYVILLNYMEAVERGDAADAAELVAGHPEFAAELQAYLEASEWLELLMARLRRQPLRR